MLVILSVFRITDGLQQGVRYNRLFLSSFARLRSYPPYLAVAILFFVCVLSGINSSNTTEWIHQMSLKIPFLAFPIIFLNRPSVSQQEYRNLYLCLIAIALVSGIHVCINYAMNYEAITYAIGSGQTIPTPTHHTRYSIMVALATLTTVVFYISENNLSPMLRKVVIGIGVLLFIFLHVLSIRSGLLALYAGVFVLGVNYLLKERRFILLGLFLFTLFLIPVIAYNTITSFYNKVHYTMYDLKMNKEGKGENYSDSERILSIKTGLNLIKENPILGTGIGDLEDTVRNIYIDDYKKNLVKLPHNQFVLAATGMGALLGLLFMISFFTPFIYQRNFTDLFMLSFFIVLTLLCLVEKPLERSNFIAFYGLFVCAGISYNLGKHNETAQ